MLFNFKLQSSVHLKPRIVTNYVTKEKELITQDDLNNLYLISNKGELIWKKQLESKIVGEISQIDLYKNGRLQYAFETEKSLIILDKNGKIVFLTRLYEEKEFNSMIQIIKTLSPKIIIYAPESKDLYKSSIASSLFNFGNIEKVMEGKVRPGHFQGVATVVEKLLNIYKKHKKLIKKLATGRHPFGVYTKGKYAYTANVYDDTITIINLEDWSTKLIKVGAHPYNVLTHQNLGFVTNTVDDSLSVIDLKIGKEIKQIYTGETPENLDVHRKLNLLVVTNWGSDSISVYSLKNLKLIKEIKTGGSCG